MRASPFVAVVAIASLGVVIVACSSSSSNGGAAASRGALDCESLAGANCWKSTVTASASCLPKPTESGTLSADGKTCSYASGALVTFDTPLTLPLNTSGGMLWSFTLTVNGALCVKVTQSDKQHQAVTTSAGTASIGTVGSSYVLSCPNGSSLSASDPLALLSCDGGLTSFPGYADSSSNDTVSFTLLGSGAAPGDAGGFLGGDGLPIFTCHK